MFIRMFLSACALFLSLSSLAQQVHYYTQNNAIPFVLDDDNIAVLIGAHDGDGAYFSDAFNFTVSMPALVVALIPPPDNSVGAASSFPILQGIEIVDSDLNVIDSGSVISAGHFARAVLPAEGQYSFLVSGQSPSTGHASFYLGVGVAVLLPDLLPIPGPVPEPSSLWLFASGLCVAGVWAQRKRSRT